MKFDIRRPSYRIRMHWSQFLAKNSYPIKLTEHSNLERRIAVDHVPAVVINRGKTFRDVDMEFRITEASWRFIFGFKITTPYSKPLETSSIIRISLECHQTQADTRDDHVL